MLTLIVENERGERLDLSPFAVYDDEDIGYMITDADGLSPAANSVGTAEYANFDGVIVSNIRTEKRNIVLTINLARDIEKSRMNLYRYFMPKKITRLYLGIGGKSLYIDGYVETFECSLFSDAETAVISLICPDPYFKAEKEYTLSVRDTTALFEFPFSIPMEGIVFSEKGTLGKSADITGGNAESGI
ncbi:MAG: phage tail domain-containing protein, partial [Porcipelethomonas sp.]